jgi:hypothetical protein
MDNIQWQRKKRVVLVSQWKNDRCCADAQRCSRVADAAIAAQHPHSQTLDGGVCATIAILCLKLFLASPTLEILFTRRLATVLDN